MRKVLLIIIFFLLYDQPVQAKQAGILHDPADPKKKYLFYLHGGIVQNQGKNAVSAVFGKYEYDSILSALSGEDIEVISEIRDPGTDLMAYAQKIEQQITKLMTNGVAADQITIVGASQGAWIALELSFMLKEKKINYALLGICNRYNMNYFSQYEGQLCGNFLSIYDPTDQKQSCTELLENNACSSTFEEVSIKLGIGHGFLFRPYDEWIIPVKEWMDKS